MTGFRAEHQNHFLGKISMCASSFSRRLGRMDDSDRSEILGVVKHPAKWMFK